MLDPEASGRAGNSAVPVPTPYPFCPPWRPHCRVWIQVPGDDHAFRVACAHCGVEGPLQRDVDGGLAMRCALSNFAHDLHCVRRRPPSAWRGTVYGRWVAS
jgi:hypothetical protein